MKRYTSDEQDILSQNLLVNYGVTLRDFKITHSPFTLDCGRWYYSGKDFSLIVQNSHTLLVENGESEHVVNVLQEVE